MEIANGTASYQLKSRRENKRPHFTFFSSQSREQMPMKKENSVSNRLDFQRNHYL